MNPFKALAKGAKKVVTAPVKVVKNTSRLLKIRSEAEDVLEIAEEAEADPRLYRDRNWWNRLLTQAGELIAVLPIALEGRVKLNDIAMKVGVVLCAIGGLVGYLAEKGILLENFLPHEYASTVGVVLGGCATVGAWLLKSPLVGKPAADPAAK